MKGLGVVDITPGITFLWGYELFMNMVTTVEAKVYLGYKETRPATEFLEDDYHEATGEGFVLPVYHSEILGLRL